MPRAKKSVTEEAVAENAKVEANAAQKEAAPAEEKPKRTRAKKAEKEEPVESKEAKEEVTEEAGSVDVKTEEKEETPRKATEAKKAAPRKKDHENDVEWNVAFYGARHETMSKELTAEKFDQLQIKSENPNEELQTAATERRKEWEDLTRSQAAHMWLEGTVSGITPLDSESDMPYLCASIKYGEGHWEILIPSFLLFDYDHNEKHKTREEYEYVQTSLIRRMGSPVKFIVRTMDKNGRVWADRLEAMSTQSIASYTTRDGSRPRIRVGMLVDAVITQRNTKSIIAEAFGAEFVIPRDKLSSVYIDDLKTEDRYEVGNHVICKITKVTEKTVTKNNNAYRLFDVEASVKDAEEEENRKVYNSYKIGGIYPAVITGIDKSIYVTLTDKNKQTAMIAFPKTGARPIVGRQRVVQVTEKDDERMFIWGIFVKP